MNNANNRGNMNANCKSGNCNSNHANSAPNQNGTQNAPQKNKMNLNPKSLDALLSVVGKKLGMPPQELRRQLESGKFDAAMGNMSPQEAQTFNKIVNDPQLADRMMSAPQAQALYKKLSGEK